MCREYDRFQRVSTKVDTYQSGAMAGRFRRPRLCRPLAGIRDGVKQKLLSDL